MWNSEKENRRESRMAFAGGGYVQPEGRKKETQRLSGAMALLLGLLVTLELMIGGAMVLNFDFHGVDGIALALVFMVLYCAVVACLTDK